MALIFDTHAHYDDARFDGDRDNFLENLETFGVKGVVNVGVDLETSQRSVEFARRFEKVFAAVGVHPEGTKKWQDNYMHKLREMAGGKSVVAVGEIGLDYHYEETDRAKQWECFEEQLSLAKELSLPVIVHSRDAADDTLAVLKNAGCKKLVVHCFSYSLNIANEFLKLGCYFGFTGVVTFKNAKTSLKVLSELPSDKILIETDCPYMAPEPYRGQRCDSGMLKFTLEKIAQGKKMSFQEAELQLNKNAREFYGIQNI